MEEGFEPGHFPVFKQSLNVLFNALNNDFQSITQHNAALRKIKKEKGHVSMNEHLIHAGAILNHATAFVKNADFFRLLFVHQYRPDAEKQTAFFTALERAWIAIKRRIIHVYDVINYYCKFPEKDLMKEEESLQSADMIKAFQNEAVCLMIMGRLTVLLKATGMEIEALKTVSDYEITAFQNMPVRRAPSKPEPIVIDGDISTITASVNDATDDVLYWN